jgi:hypothetical protein
LLLASRYRKRIRASPFAMAFVTRTGVSFGGVAGGPHASEAEGALAPHAVASRASVDRSRRSRRGTIVDRVSASVGTCRQGRMAAS